MGCLTCSLFLFFPNQQITVTCILLPSIKKVGVSHWLMNLNYMFCFSDRQEETLCVEKGPSKYCVFGLLMEDPRGLWVDSSLTKVLTEPFEAKSISFCLCQFSASAVWLSQGIMVTFFRASAYLPTQSQPTCYWSKTSFSTNAGGVNAGKKWTR